MEAGADAQLKTLHPPSNACQRWLSCGGSTHAPHLSAQCAGRRSAPYSRKALLRISQQGLSFSSHCQARVRLPASVVATRAAAGCPAPRERPWPPAPSGRGRPGTEVAGSEHDQLTISTPGWRPRRATWSSEDTQGSDRPDRQDVGEREGSAELNLKRTQTSFLTARACVAQASGPLPSGDVLLRRQCSQGEICTLYRLASITSRARVL